MTDKREYQLRRWHSFLGVVPIGIYLIVHLVVNHFATYSEEAYNEAANFMGNLPLRILLEIGVIYIPILFHGIYGVYIAFTSELNLGRYGWFRNWMFFVQRITGIITLIFIAWHVWETRLANLFFGTPVNFDMMANILSSPFMFWFYIVGVISAVFHFSNGLWSFFVTWGLTITPRSQRFMTIVTLFVFIIMSYLGISSLIAFAY